VVAVKAGGLGVYGQQRLTSQSFEQAVEARLGLDQANGVSVGTGFRRAVHAER
jgi:hypothetical protein